MLELDQFKPKLPQEKNEKPQDPKKIEKEITKLEKDAFLGLNNLTELDLRVNQIKKIKKDTFSGLKYLKRIQINQNKFKTNVFFRLTLESSVEFVSWTNSNDSFNPENEIHLVFRKVKYFKLTIFLLLYF